MGQSPGPRLGRPEFSPSLVFGASTSPTVETRGRSHSLPLKSWSNCELGGGPTPEGPGHSGEYAPGAQPGLRLGQEEVVQAIRCPDRKTRGLAGPTPFSFRLQSPPPKIRDEPLTLHLCDSFPPPGAPVSHTDGNVWWWHLGNVEEGALPRGCRRGQKGPKPVAFKSDCALQSPGDTFNNAVDWAQPQAC